MGLDPTAGLLISLAPALMGSVVGAVLARSHARRVARSLSPDVSRTVEVLRGVPLEDRVAELASLAPPSSWEGELASELARAGHGAARAAALDDALADLEGQLQSVRGWSETALRVAILGGLLGASAGAIAAGLVEALAALSLGVVGAGFAAAFGRRARAFEAGHRRRADDLVTLLAGGRAGGERRPRRALGPSRRGLDRIEPAG